MLFNYIYIYIPYIAEAVSKREKEKEQEKLGVQEQVGSNLKAIMTNQFTEQVGSAQTDDQAHLKRMEAYIDEKMGVIQENIPAKVITEEDKLFEIAQVAKNSTTDEGSIGYIVIYSMFYVLY